MQRELLEKIIDLTLDQVREKGFELLDESENTQVQIVADAIERDVEDFIEDLEMEDDWEEGFEPDRNEVELDDDDMIVLDDGPLRHWNEDDEDAGPLSHWNG